MTLPQPISHLLSIPVCLAIIVAGFAIILSLGAQAATQQLTCTPSALQFGTVQIGETKTEIITLTNSGQTGVKVSAINLSGPEFSVSRKLPFTLSAGEASPSM